MQNKQKYINTMYPKSQFPVWSKARLYIYPYAFFFADICIWYYFSI